MSISNSLKGFFRTHLSPRAFEYLLRKYHFLLAVGGALLYGFPSRDMMVIGVTGTKGKSSTTEMLSAIFEEAGLPTAVLNSIRIKIGTSTEPNIMRMSMPGRFYIQNFLSKARAQHVQVAILEMTSEGSRQFRHRGIDMDALIFTNLAPEHIESHGSYEKYADAKVEIGHQLERSSKRPRMIVTNADDPVSQRFLALHVEHLLPFTLSANTPFSADEHGGEFTFDSTKIHINLPGEFSLKNALAAATAARALGVDTQFIKKGLEKITTIPGRAERIEAGQDYAVVVDYAHTPDSLTALYEAYKPSRKICVLGSTGGGRDMWKRPVMGGVADSYCDEVILTNEDPYDEDPRSIVDALAHGMKRTPTIIMDRREAIAKALSLARPGDAVLITGKGTDPCICGPRGTKVPWSDAQVAREEIVKALGTKTL